MDVPRFSKSFYHTAKRCPLKGYLHHVERIKSESSPAAANGIEVHYFRSLLLPGKISLEEALTRASNDEVRKLIPLAAQDIFKGKGKHYYEMEVSLDLDGEIAVLG